jgi:hypothetical protein
VCIFYDKDDAGSAWKLRELRFLQSAGFSPVGCVQDARFGGGIKSPCAGILDTKLFECNDMGEWVR